MASAARAQTASPNFYITNGQVTAEALRGNTLYLGGNFSFVGPVTGAGVPVDITTALPAAGFPRVTGTVLSALPDGAGGWYIGGQFSAVGAVSRTNIARVLANNTVAAWNPSANGIVRTMVLRAGLLYVGGDFGVIGGAVRNRIAALDATTGVATAWNPIANGSVRAFAAGASVLYVGGQFTGIGGQLRNRIAALDFVTGLADPLWDPNASGPVLGLALDPVAGTLYVGGQFTSIDAVVRKRVAALEALTGFSTPWNPAADNAVFSLIANGGTIYAGGMFNNIGGQVRSGIAALDAVTGLASAWNPNADNIVQAMALAGPNLYVGGDFLNIGGQNRSRVAALSTASGLATSWNPSAFGTVSVVASGAAQVFVGGSFSGVGGVARNNLAAVDVTTGVVTAWDPNANNQVQAMALTSDVLYVGGNFTLVGGQIRNSIAALDLTNGNATNWDPNGNGLVSALAVSGNRVYAGGLFTTIGGQPHANLAALDATTGLASAWSVDTDAQVFAIDASTPTVYIGGSFTLLGGLPRNFIGAADPLTAAVSAWAPNATSNVMVIRPTCDRVYVGGFFSSIGGQVRSRVASLDPITGLALAWDPGANGPVFALEPARGVVYLGGVFNAVGLVTRNRVAAVDPQTGVATAWDANSNGTVRSLVTDGNSVYIGGVFSSMTGVLAGNLAALTPDVTAPCPLISLTPPPLPSGVIGAAYAVTLTASGGIGPYCYGLSSGTLPTGLSLNPATGQLAGTPISAGNLAFTITATDTRGCSASAVYTLGVTAPSTADNVAVGGGGPCLSPALTAVSVPFTFTNGDATGLRGMSVTFQLDAAKLRLVTPGSPASNVHLGTWASAFANRSSQVTDLGGGRYAVDILLLGSPCGVTTGGTLFTLDVAAQGPAGLGSITVTSVLARDCTNAPVAVAAGAPGSVGVLASTLAVSPGTLPGGTESAAYSQLISATGGVAPFTFALSAGALPPGLTLSTTGVLAGVCSQAGTFAFTALVTEATGCAASQSYSIVVTCPTITVTPPFLPDGSVGTPYSGSVAASGGVAPYTFSVTTGALPAGVTLSAAGLLSGTPTATATSTFSIQVADAGGCTGTRSYTVDIYSAPPNSFVAANPAGLAISTAHPCVTVPLVYTRGETTSARGVTVSFQLDPARLGLCSTPAASIHLGPWFTGFANTSLIITDDGGGAYTVSASLLGTPCGITTGGTPLTVDVHSIGGDGQAGITVTRVKAQTCGNTALAIAAGGVGSLRIQNTPIALAPTVLPNGAAGTPYSQTFTAQSGLAPFTFSVSAGALPTGLTLSSGGVLSGTPTTAGSFSFTVSVADVAGVPGSVAYTMSVTPGPPSALSYTVGPSNVVAGASIAPAPKVLVSDAFGNAVPGQPVSLSLVGTGTLTGGGVVTSNAAGIATFPALSVNLAGSKQLTAASGAVAPATSAAFTVTPAAAAALTFAVAPSNTIAGLLMVPGVQVQVSDAFGNTLAGQSVSLALVGTGTLTGGAAVVSDSAGIATFSGLSLNLAGSKQLTATSGVVPTVTSTSFTVSPAGVAAVAFTVPPANAVAGAAIAPSVQVKLSDAFGNGVPSKTVSLVLVGTGTLSGITSATSDASGIASFPGLSVNLVGSKQLSASSGMLLPTVTSVAFTVSPAAAAALTFTAGPSDVVAGVAMAPALQLKLTDAFGNSVPGGLVSLALVGTGTLTGGGSVTSDANGLATFPAVSLNLVGSKQLTASSGALPPVTSPAFTVSPAAAAALTFAVAPNNVVAGVAIAPAVQVKVSDAFSNAVAGQLVSLSLVGTGTLTGGGALTSDAAGLVAFSGSSVNLTGVKRLTATSGVLPPVTSATFTVSPAAPAALTYAAGPNGVVAGAAIAPAVQVKVSDAFGNGVSGQLISLSLVGTGALTGGAAVTSDANGLTTFAALSVNLVGSKQLTASSGVLAPVTSVAFAVSPAAPASLAFTASPSAVIAGVAIAPAVQVRVSDAFGNVVPGQSISLSLLGTGTLTGGGAVASDTTGLATFSALNVNLAGSKQLVAASGVLPTVTSAAFAVSPAAASALTFAVGPSNVAAGVAIAPSVQVKVSDAFGNGIAGQSVSLVLVGTGTLTGGGAVVTSAAGLATFAGASVNLVGSKQLTAASGVLPNVTSTAFTVSPAAASALTFASGPSNVVAGVAIAPAVQVRVNDAFGNAVPGQLISMSLVGTGTLSGGGAVASDAAGLATFSAASVNLVGSKQLTAASGLLPTVTSAAFTVSPAAASALTFAVGPSNVVAGVAIAPAVQVKVSDAFGNGITAQSVSLSLVGTGTLTGGGAIVSDATGIASFSALSVNLTGSKQLTAASGLLPTVTSAAFTVSSAPASALTFAVGPSNVVAGVAIAPAVQVKVSDAFGNGVPAKSVSLVLVGSGTLTGGSAVVSDAAGLATFAAASVNLAGSKQLIASSGVLPTVTSAAFTVSPAAAAALTFAVGPSNVAAGVAITPAVQVKLSDAFGNGVAGQLISMSLVGTGTLTGGSAVTSDAAGLASFSVLSVNLTGSKQLAAASGVLPTVTSAAFTVSSAAATALTFVVGPSSVVAGVAIAPAVQVKVSDAFGNGVPARSVSLALVGSGTLSGGGAVLSDAAGLATFSGASVNLVGSKQLTATSGVLPTVTSAAFSVSPATAAALTFAVAPSNVAAGAAIAPAIQVKVSDAFGNGIAGQLISMSLVGTGTLSGGGAVASDAAGLVTFPAASVNLSGSKQLTAASGVLPSVTSAAFTVSSAAATALTFAVGPSTVVAGVAIAPAVQVKVSDAFGNGVPARSVSLALAGTGTLTGGGAVVSDAAGLATFPALSVDLAGSKQLTAASGVLPTVTSAAFIVSPAAAVALAFAAGPSNVVAGVAIAPAVQVKVSDAFGNGVPAKSVSLALVGTGTLSGGGAVVSDAAGLATFSGASVNLVGSKQLIATSGVLPAVTSAAFGVSPATAAALTFVVGPSNVVAGVAIAPAVQVKVSDAFGNGIAGQLISMSLVGTGTLSGGSAVTSDAAGLVSFAALSVNLSGSKQLTAASGVLPTVTSAAFTVACPVITLPAFALPDAKRGVAYSQSFTASGGTGPYRYTVTTGALPAGLVLSTAGSLSGTPTVTGTASFTVSATDAFNCTGATSYTLSVFIDPAISLILPVTTGLCVSTSQPCVTVPFVYQRGEASAARSAHVVFQLDSRFALCTPATPTTSIRAGSWLSTFTNTTFQVTDNGAGSYTVDLSLTGLPCGQTAGGTLFTVDVAGVGGDGIGNLTVTACRTLDCSSLPLPAQPGAPAPLNLDHVSPGRITDLASAQIAPVVVAGGATDSLATLRLTWTPSPSNIISIYRAPFGTYPEYDDLGGTLPDSAAAPAAPWVLVSASATSPFVDRPPVRGSWHYVAFVADSCGNRAAVSNLTQGSLDYLLGDVSDKVTRGVGNDRVGVEDVSLLASHYGLSGAQIVTANVAYLDVGPTLDGTVNSRPTTDDLIDFQDLAIFSLNFKVTPFGASARPAAPPAPSDGLETFELRAPAIVGPGADVPVVLHVAAAGAMQAFSVQLAWNPFVVQPIDMASGGFVESQGGIVLSARAGDVDAALLGVGEHGMLGSGDVATLHFHVIREGDPGLRIANLIARDASNRPVDPARLGDAVVAAPPAHTLLLAPTPNPARDAATLAFGLAQRGSVDLGLYAVDGRRVRTLAHGLREPGVYRITWKGDDDGGHSQGPGVYWARLTADGRTFTRRLVYLK